MGTVGSHCTSHQTVEIEDISVPVVKTEAQEGEITEKVRNILY